MVSLVQVQKTGRHKLLVSQEVCEKMEPSRTSQRKCGAQLDKGNQPNRFTFVLNLQIFRKICRGGQ
jgi:hypothetical protein